jgi:hypothetical protein
MRKKKFGNRAESRKPTTNRNFDLSTLKLKDRGDLVSVPVQHIPVQYR